MPKYKHDLQGDLKYAKNRIRQHAEDPQALCPVKQDLAAQTIPNKQPARSDASDRKLEL